MQQKIQPLTLYTIFLISFQKWN